MLCLTIAKLENHYCQLPLNNEFAMAPQGAIGFPSTYANGSQSADGDELSLPKSCWSSLDFT